MDNNKKKVIDSLLKKKIEGLRGIYGGVACTAPPKPIVITKCYICTVTPPQNPGVVLQVRHNYLIEHGGMVL